MKHMMGKLLATMVTMLHLISGSIMTMESAWNGLPGGLVRALCFHPETQVELKNGEIPLGDSFMHCIRVSGGVFIIGF